MNAVETRDLGRRYGRTWALRGCAVAVPHGRVVALVGPNGAGKTTLLQAIAGLTTPTTGEVRVFGAPPATDPDGLARVAFVAQDVPLYRSLTIGQTFAAGRRLNLRWDDDLAVGHVARLDLGLDERVGNLSGGQRAQVALALALATRPDLLLLDEPLASLDPLSRRAFLQELMAAAAERELTIVFSSHLIGDLERVCDHLILLDRARTLLADDIDDLLAAHGVLTGPGDPSAVPGVEAVVREERAGRETTAVVRMRERPFDPAWRLAPIGLEELILAYLEPGGDGRAAAPALEVLS